MKDEQLKQGRAEIIPARLAIEAMRDSGYNDTSYALAELIDNSVQADACAVEVFCLQENRLVNKRNRLRLSGIAVLDDGHGMDSDTLQIALQFGNGTRLQDRRGIGRFGMGLPNASISQCRRVEIWTWQNGPDNALHTYLDVDEVKFGALRSIPMPSPKPLPPEWSERSDILKTTGTLVVWSKLDDDRVTWKSSTKTWEHTENLVGRIYRKFIDTGTLQISMVSITGNDKPVKRYVRVNDPLYLMTNSSTPDPYDREPMFLDWGETKIPINWGGENHDIVIRMSYARQETVPSDGSARGAQPYGRHALKNVGVSVVRAGRELQLDTNWAIQYDTRERWWGAEVEFPPALDSIFGVTNNKQTATKFSAIAKFDYESELDPGESTSAYVERMKEDGDAKGLLLEVKAHIEAQLKQIRDKIKDQRKGASKKDERHDQRTTEDVATSSFRKRQRQGHETDFDKEEFSEEHRDILAENLKSDKHYPKSEAEKIADATLQRDRKVLFITKAMEGYGFFNVEMQPGGIAVIVFNTNHPLYMHLIGTLEFEFQNFTQKELLEKLDIASETMKLLFAAWARYEIEEGKREVSFRELKQEWGKMAEIFLTDSLDS